MITFKTYIFKLLPFLFKKEDTYKNVNGEGLFERFTQALGEELDQEVIPAVQGLLDIVDPLVVDSSLIPYASMQKGINFTTVEDIATQRKIIRYAIRINKLRGTKRAYELILGILGYNNGPGDVVLTEIVPTECKYDSGCQFDITPAYQFDTACPVCSDYTLELTSSVLPTYPTLLTTSQYKTLLNAIKYVEPIIAKLKFPIKLNSVNITQIIVPITFDGLGNPIEYYNDFDPTLDLSDYPTINSDVAANYNLYAPLVGDPYLIFDL